MRIFYHLNWWSDLDYSIEIELPGSGAWFRYFTNIDTLEEAESVKQAAQGSIKARILKNI